MSASAGASRASWRPEKQAGGEHVAAEDLAVRPREIDVLEHALADGLGREGMEGTDAVAIGDHQLAGLDVAHVLGVDQVEGAGLGADDGGPVQPAQDQRAEAPGVAGRHQRVGGEEEQREGPHHLRQAGRDRVLEPLAVASRVEVQDHLGVRGGLEDRARRLQLVAQDRRVHQVAVVAHRDGPAVALDEIGLGIGGHGVARRGVAHVAHGPVALEQGQPLVREDVVDEAHPLLDAQALAVARDDARRLLPAVLLGVEAEVGEVGRFRVAEDAEEAAAVVEPVVVDAPAALLGFHASESYRAGPPKGTSRRAPQRQTPRESWEADPPLAISSRLESGSY